MLFSKKIDRKQLNEGLHPRNDVCRKGPQFLLPRGGALTLEALKLYFQQQILNEGSDIAFLTNITNPNIYNHVKQSSLDHKAQGQPTRSQ
jgi:hypothetical protein